MLHLLKQISVIYRVEGEKLSNLKIKIVEQNSIANEVGIEAGDELLSINGVEIQDVFDYRFQIYNNEITLLVQKVNGEEYEIEIEKDEYEDIGIEFEDGLLDDCKSCTNKCIFCFIDQLPKGMRETVYFKDDDTRLSFLSGNYVTLTNIKDTEIDRIIKYRMSPINVSVHTTNPELRKYMLGNRFAGDILEKIKKLTDNGITVNCQIVLCREINDGKELDRSLNDLSKFFPRLESISVVPVGITKYREGLTFLKPFDEESSLQVLKQLNEHQTKFSQKHGMNIVYAADEFYIMSGTPIPDYKYYEDFPQIENGVGMIAMLQKEFNNTLRRLKRQTKTKKKHEVHYQYIQNENRTKYSEISLNEEILCNEKNKKSIDRKVTIATGMSAYMHIKRLADRLNNNFGIQVEVLGVKNNFFGENVTVTGLLTGQDIAKQLFGKVCGDEVLICRNMLRSGETTFLDDWTVEMLEKHLGKKVIVVDNSGEDFIKKILGNIF